MILYLTIIMFSYSFALCTLNISNVNILDLLHKLFPLSMVALLSTVSFMDT